jgi:uncharacterized protein YjiS (DUF1127 family)
MANIGIQRSQVTAFGAWLRSARRDLVEERQRRRLYNETYSQLAALSDRDLWDIGLSRLQITDIARDAAYGR